MTSLTKKELEIMKVLWEGSELKPAEIQELVPGGVGNAALRSLLLVLLEKGHVQREKRGKAFYYRATTSRAGVFHSMIRQVANVFSGGSPRRLMAQLVESEDLSAEDVKELKRLLNDKETEK